jgi:DNA polymerase-3 subunit chi
MSQKRADFYLLQDSEPNASLFFACRLLEKAYRKKHRVFVYCEDKIIAEQLDELLWSFKDASFIPHNLQGEGPEPPPPIQIGYTANQNPIGYHDILLNLANTIPKFYQQFKRIFEIVTEDESTKITRRRHYQAYRQQGMTVKTHPIHQNIEHTLTH